MRFLPSNNNLFFKGLTFLFVLVIFFSAINISPVKAYDFTAITTLGSKFSTAASKTAMPFVNSAKNVIGGITNVVGSMVSAPVNVVADQPLAQDKIWAAINDALISAAKGAIKGMLRSVVRDTAYTLALNLTSGNKGQTPYFWERDAGTVWSMALDEGAGTALQGMVESWNKSWNVDVKKYENNEKNAAKEYEEACDSTTQALMTDCMYGDLLKKYNGNVALCRSEEIPKFAQCTAALTKYQKASSDASYAKDQAAMIAKTKPRDITDAYTYGVAVTDLICKPDPAAGVLISLGLTTTTNMKPTCSGKTIMDNWKAAFAKLDDGMKTFGESPLKAIASMFNPGASETSIYWYASLSTSSQAVKAAQDSLFDRLTHVEGIKDVTGTIDKNVKTPASLLYAQTQAAFYNTLQPDTNFIGDVVADSVSTFSSTFISTLTSQLFKGLKDYLNQEAGSAGLYNSSYYSFNGVKAAQKRLATLSNFQFTTNQNLMVLSEIVCPQSQPLNKQFFPEQPFRCLIDEPYRAAIENKWTVKKAMEEYRKTGQGLNPDGIFGFTKEGGEPSVYGNFPYSKMPILRKYRILPTSWEIAALYLKDHYEPPANHGYFTLSDVVKMSKDKTSPLYGLIDENWILKVPVAMCVLNGPGPLNLETTNSSAKVCLYDTNGDGKICCCPGNAATCSECPKPDLMIDPVNRMDYCADEQTCLEHNDKGECLSGRYGYCLAEKKVWRFPEESKCEQKFNGCQSYTSSEGKQESYIISTLKGYKDVCKAENAGCHWVSNDLTVGSDNVYRWKESSGKKEYFTQKAVDEACGIESQGCTKVGTDTFLKLPPAYLNCESNPDKPACLEYTAVCRAEQVGCNRYDATDGSNTIYGKNPRTCEAACIGLQSYFQMPTQFEQAQYSVNFIPEKAQMCSPQEVGCDEFTNLDELDKGGEAVHNYSFIQACESLTQDSPAFYAWQGSDKGGYQLMTYRLKAKSDGSPACSSTSNPRECYCDYATFSAGMTNNNYACQELFNEKGDKFYIRLQQAVMLTDDCHPLRKTGDSAVVVKGSTSLSKACSMKGCRMYLGTGASNVALPVKTDFEDSTAQNWTGNVEVSNDAIKAGQHSIKVNSGDIGHAISIDAMQKGGQYEASFWLKGLPNQTSVIMVKIVSASGQETWFKDGTNNSDSVRVDGGDWKLYSFNLTSFDRTVETEGEKLVITGGGTGFYIDNIILQAVNATVSSSNIVYAVKDKFNLGSCDAKVATNIGCKSYTDATGTQGTFSSFDSGSCSARTVGCSAVTKTDPLTEESSTVYIVPDNNFACSADAVGCTLYGKPVYDKATGLVNQWQNVYYKNAKGGYKCSEGELGCKAYKKTDKDETVYFKDPGNNLCSWDDKNGWHKKVCKVGGQICGQDSDCSGAGNLCLVKSCSPINSDQSINTGVAGLVFGGTTTTTNEVIMSSNFETDIGGWARENNEGTIERSGAQKHGGDYSLKVQLSNVDGSNQAKFYHNIDQTKLIKNGKYEISFWARPLDANQYPFITAKFINGNNAQDLSFKDNTNNVATRLNSDTWKQYVMVLDNFSRDAASNEKLLLTSGGSSGYGYYIDDIEFKKIGTYSASAINTIPTSSTTTSASSSAASTASNNDVYVCPATENGCRAVVDPACVVPAGSTSSSGTLRTSDYGLNLPAGRKCERNYFIKNNEEVMNGCNGKVDANEGCILFNDTTNSTLNYDSQAHYIEYQSESSKADFNGISLNDSLFTVGIDKKDANVLYKVQPDRECDTWMACTSWIESEAREGAQPTQTCFSYKPCDEDDGTGKCSHFLDKSIPGSVSNELLSRLSGWSRPDATISGWTSKGGHGFVEDMTVDGSPTYKTNGSVPNVLNINLKDNKNNKPITNSCRLYPAKNAPVSDQQWNKIETKSDNSLKNTAYYPNGCDYIDENMDRRQGLYGFCIEKYPQTTGPNATGKAYKDWCLNWYPASYIKGQYDVFRKEDQLAPYTGPKPLYYCLQSKGGSWSLGAPGKIGVSEPVYKDLILKTRDTYYWRIQDMFSNPTNSDEIAAKQKSVIDAVSGAKKDLEIFSAYREFNIYNANKPTTINIDSDKFKIANNTTVDQDFHLTFITPFIDSRQKDNYEYRCALNEGENDDQILNTAAHDSSKKIAAATGLSENFMLVNDQKWFISLWYWMAPLNDLLVKKGDMMSASFYLRVKAKPNNETPAGTTGFIPITCRVSKKLSDSEKGSDYLASFFGQGNKYIWQQTFSIPYEITSGTDKVSYDYSNIYKSSALNTENQTNNQLLSSIDKNNDNSKFKISAQAINNSWQSNQGSTLTIGLDKMTSDSYEQSIPANDAEKILDRDQIAQIKYIVEHRTRYTFPGYDYNKKNINKKQWYDYLRLFFVQPFGSVFGYVDPMIRDALEADSPKPVIDTTADSQFTMLIKNQKANDVTEENVWGHQCVGAETGGESRDFFAIQPQFENNKLKAWKYRYCDDSSSPNNDEIYISTIIYLKDYCTEIAEVVDEAGNAVPWYQRAQVKGPHGLPLARSGAGKDVEAIQAPDGNPETWTDPIPMILTTQNLDAAFAPYSFQSQTEVMPICLGDPETLGKYCTDSSDCRSGYCVGSAATERDLATKNLQLTFNKIYKTWKWDNTQRRYIVSNDNLFNGTENECGKDGKCVNNRDSVGDIGGNRPKILNLSITNTIINKGVVRSSLKFDSEVDTEQKPLKEIEIDWGDGARDLMNLSTDDSVSLKRPHNFIHIYDSCKYWCGNTANQNWCKNTETGCVYYPKVRIKDNWGWCSSIKTVKPNMCSSDSTTWEMPLDIASKKKPEVIITTK